MYIICIHARLHVYIEYLGCLLRKSNPSTSKVYAMLIPLTLDQEEKNVLFFIPDRPL